MGCIDAIFTKVNPSFSVDMSRLDTSGELSIGRVDKTIFSLSEAETSVTLNPSRVNKALNIICTMICSIEDAFYMEVEDKLIWLTEYNDYSDDIEIRANVKWIIV